MGICENQFDFVNNYAIGNIMKKTNIKMLELGDQVVNPSLSEKMEGTKTGKEMYTKMGYYHTSFDLNHKNGSICVDLTKSHTKFNDMYDIITDHGTIEHVHDQYAVFKNIHDWGKLGCVYVHCVPLIGYEHIKYIGYEFPPHGDFEYSSEFWVELCKACDYKLIISRGDLVHNPGKKFPKNFYSSSCYIKTTNKDFIDMKQFYDIFNKYNKKTTYKLSDEQHRIWWESVKKTK
jgi:hypothetical protein